MNTTHDAHLDLLLTANDIAVWGATDNDLSELADRWITAGLYVL